MITYKPQNTKDFIFSLSVIANFADEGYFRITENGIMSFGIGPSRIVTYYFKMGDIDMKTEAVSFGINCKDLMKIFNRLRTNESVIFNYDETNRKIKIIAKSQEDKRTFIVKEIDVDYQEIPFENLFDLPYSVMIEIEAKEFSRILNDCDVYSEFIKIHMNGEEIKFTASSVIGSVVIEKELNKTIISPDTFVVGFSIPFLEVFFKNMGSKEIQVLLGYSDIHGELPIYINYEENETKLSVFVAPRVE